jgi:hypothetical protein
VDKPGARVPAISTRRRPAHRCAFAEHPAGIIAGAALIAGKMLDKTECTMPSYKSQAPFYPYLVLCYPNNK